jgi:hypothetical protein
VSGQHNLVNKQRPTPHRKNLIGLVPAILTLATIVAVAVWLVRSQLPATPQPAEAAETTTKPSLLTPTGRTSEFQALLGRWQRPDGGYVLQITNADENGKLDAAYFNPKSIHVSRAQALRQGSALKIFVELRDANYPGSTYALAHDPADDRLKGIYYQAALGQQFEVTFERLK